MGFNDRLQTIRDEIEGTFRSRLQKETGYSIQEWRAYLDAFFAVMWPPPQSFVSPRTDVVRDYVTASAILEWAAINAGDAFDPWVHDDEGPQFDKSPGAGASIGPFQGYAAESYKALRDNAELRRLVKRISGARSATTAKGDPPPIPKSRIGRIYEGVRSPGRVPGPEGSKAPSADLDKRLRQVLSEYDNLRDPFISLIGKMQLSVDYAEATSIFRDYRSETQMSHAWRLPDPTLRYVLLVYEVSGGDDDWLSKVTQIIWDADAAANYGKDSKKRLAVLNFPFKDGRIGYVFNVLGMNWNAQCRYDQLVNIW